MKITFYKKLKGILLTLPLLLIFFGLPQHADAIVPRTTPTVDPNAIHMTVNGQDYTYQGQVGSQNSSVQAYYAAQTGQWYEIDSATGRTVENANAPTTLFTDQGQVNYSGNLNNYAPATTKTPVYQCSTSLWSGPTWDTCAALFGTKILQAVSWVLWAVGILFNAVVGITVVSMKNTLDGITAINIAWKVFRDLSNILFIFVLLYISISTILGTGGVDAKKMVAKLVIAALLINFSLFFTKVIVDASNILAIQFYNAILTKDGANIVNTGVSTWSSIGNADGGLSSAFVSALNLTSIYSSPDVNGNTVGAQNIADSNQGTHLFKIFLATVSGSIFILVVAFAFLSATLIFVYRFIMIVILMILSPFAYAAVILPYTSKYSKQWWDKLTSEALVAPLFFMMIWVTLKIVGDHGFVGGSFAGVSGGSASNIGIILNFAIVIGFLFASISMSKVIGSYGGGAAVKAFDGIRSRAQGAAGRTLVRRTGLGWVDDKFQNSSFGKSAFGSSIRNATTGAAVKQKFGSKTNLEKVYKDEKKQGEERAKLEFERVKKQREKMVDKDTAHLQRPLDEARKELALAHEGLLKAKTPAEIDIAKYHVAKWQDEINGTEGIKGLKDIVGDARKKAEGELGSLAGAQAGKANMLDKRSLTTLGFKSKARKAAVKAFRDAAKKGKSFGDVQDEKQRKQIKKALEGLDSKNDEEKPAPAPAPAAGGGGGGAH